MSVRYLKSSRRNQHIAIARHTVMYILRTELKTPLLKTAPIVGRKDHTTVINACAVVEKKLKEDPAFAEKVERCRKEIFY